MQIGTYDHLVGENNVDVMSPEQIREREQEILAFVEQQAAAEAEATAKAEARAALLERLGITADEAALLLS